MNPLMVVKCLDFCSECQRGEKSKQARVNDGSSHDFLKVASSERQSDGNAHMRRPSCLVAQSAPALLSVRTRT